MLARGEEGTTMRRFYQAMAVLSVVGLGGGCDGGGVIDGAQTTSAELGGAALAGCADPATNLVRNGGFEEVYFDGVRNRPFDWEANQIFKLPPTWEADPSYRGAVYAGTSGHLGVETHSGDFVAVLSGGGMHIASIAQALPDLGAFSAPQVFAISFWHNLYAYSWQEPHETFVAKLQAWLYEVETGDFHLLHLVTYKDKNPQPDDWRTGGSIRGWQQAATVRKLDPARHYVLVFQILTESYYLTRATAYLDDVCVTPIPASP
jgi:hypothetical protein